MPAKGGTEERGWARDSFDVRFKFIQVLFRQTAYLCCIKTALPLCVQDAEQHTEIRTNACLLERTINATKMVFRFFCMCGGGGGGN